jgi:poly(hydroxyalkanoate) granule-associated protein
MAMSACLCRRHARECNPPPRGARDRAYTGSPAPSKTRGEAAQAAGASAQAIRDSAQRIWLAGLGAFEHARSEGPRVFDALVAQGRTLGARAASAADEALRSLLELNENLRGMRGTAAGGRRKARPAAKARPATAKARKAGSARAGKARSAKKRKAGGARRKARA